MNTGKIKHNKAATQDLMPGNYSTGVKTLSIVAFLYAIIAYLNESVFHFIQNTDGSYPFWLSHWTEYIIIVLFGTWRTVSEKNPYTRKRLAVLTMGVGIFWWIIPVYLKIPEPFLGTLPKEPVFPHLHTPGTITFFLTLVLVLLFGRRVICGWFCPCVGIRETVGFPFRINTIQDNDSYKYRHIKWIFFILYVVSFILIMTNSSHVSTFYKIFLGLLVVPYFLAFLLSPFIGNRSYCRFICPYGATFGILNRIGFFNITLNQDKCTSCQLCEKVCDMGIPVMTEGKEKGHISSIEECMGCKRCVEICKNDALETRDIRSHLFPLK